MHNLRDNVFETNSSSSHSISLGERDIFDRNFRDEHLRSGIVSLRFTPGIYDDWFRFYTAENILVFLILSEIESYFFDDARYKRFEHLYAELNPVPGQEVDILPIMKEAFPVVTAAIEFLEEETGLQFRFMSDLPNVGKFDTGNLAAESGYLNDCSVLKRALFNSKSYVQTTPENAWALSPPTIPTDLGRDDIIEDYEEKKAELIENINSFTELMETIIKEKKSES